MSDRITAYALYTDPPLGRAGMTGALIGVGKQGNSIAAKAESSGSIDGSNEIRPISGAACLTL